MLRNGGTEDAHVIHPIVLEKARIFRRHQSLDHVQRHLLQRDWIAVSGHRCAAIRRRFGRRRCWRGSSLSMSAKSNSSARSFVGLQKNGRGYQATDGHHNRHEHQSLKPSDVDKTAACSDIQTWNWLCSRQWVLAVGLRCGTVLGGLSYGLPFPEGQATTHDGRKSVTRPKSSPLSKKAASAAFRSRISWNLRSTNQSSVYYSRPRPIGRKGDFYTSVSVGPCFGMLLARKIREVQQLLGEPEGFTVIEQGAQRWATRR